MKRWFLLLICVGVATTLVATPTYATNLNSNQAVYANALGLQFLPNLGTHTAGVCLVDTGVDLNPGTQHSITGRIGVGGVDPADHSPEKHGTNMAQVMASPITGWGAVGTWPAARIFSIRGLGVTYFPRSIRECTRQAKQHNLKVIEIAFGAPGVDSRNDPQLINTIEQARANGLNVVAAAGDEGGHILSAPANYPPVFAVGGVDTNGELCRYEHGGRSNLGAGLDINTLGCEIDVAHPQTGQPGREDGTSHASAFVAATLAALRTYRPDLTPDQAEQILLDTATTIPSGKALNAHAAFQKAGLAQQWDTAIQQRNNYLQQLQPQHTPPALTLQPKPTRSKPNTRHLPTPKIRVRKRGTKRLIQALNRPVGATIEITIRQRGKKPRTIRTRSSKIMIKASRNAQVRVRYKKGGIVTRHVCTR